MLRCVVCGAKQVCSVPITVSVVDAAADVLGVALVAVAGVGLALDDLRAAALAVRPVAALAGSLALVLAVVAVVVLVVSESGGGEERQAVRHDEEQLLGRGSHPCC